jgi:hypothetical protein
MKYLYVLHGYDHEPEGTWRYEPHDETGPYTGESFKTQKEALEAGKEVCDSILRWTDYEISIDE